MLSLATSVRAQAATAVTTERLRQPPATEWLTYGLDHSEARFSPSPASPWNGGVLVTASDVRFSGRRSGALVAHDARTGAVLWENVVGPGLALVVDHLTEHFGPRPGRHAR